MAAGEYISVSSQRDTEAADVEKEREQQEKGPEVRLHPIQGPWLKHITGAAGMTPWGLMQGLCGCAGQVA